LIANEEVAEAKRNAELAIDALGKAVAGGYENIDWIKSSTYLDPIRDRDDFKKLVAEMGRRIAEKRLAAITDPKPDLPAPEAVKSHTMALQARRQAAKTDPNSPEIRAGMAANLRAIGVAQLQLKLMALGRVLQSSLSLDRGPWAPDAR
jgi:hypothetical protein